MLLEKLEVIIIGVLSGIVSAFIFHLILKLTKPQIIISDKIEKRVDSNGNIVYHIKVVNLRKRFVVNVIPYLDLVHSEKGPGGIILRLKALNIDVKSIPYIDPYDRRDSYCKYAVRVEIKESLETVWANDTTQSLRLLIYCVDEFSGAGKFFEKNYYQRNCIKEGKFVIGKSVEVTSSK